MDITVQTGTVLGYFLAATRILAWLLIVPPFNGRFVPFQAKVVLSFGLAFATPQPAATRVPSNAFALMFEVLVQVGIGLALGFVAFVLLSAIAAAGSLIDVFGGFSLSTAYDPLNFQQASIFGRFYQMLSTVLLFASGGMLVMVGGLIKTFEFLPVGELPEPSNFSYENILTAFTTFFLIAVQLALPMIAVLMIADLGLALLTKVSPQMQAISFLFPAKIGLVLLLVGTTFTMLPGASDRLVELVVNSMSVISGGGGG